MNIRYPIYEGVYRILTLYKLSNLLQETFFSLCSHVAFGLPDMNCVAKVLVMSFLYARSKTDGSRQNLHPSLRTGSI